MSGNVPRNTTEQAKRDPLSVLVEAMVMGSENAILHRESRGQQELVNSTVLPTEMNDSDQQALARVGVRFFGPVDGDPLFTTVELPAGWTKKATEHSMWSNLLDEQGRVRARIFYKGAFSFYDRRASLTLAKRFEYHLDYDEANKGLAVAYVTDCGREIYRTDPVKLPSDDRRWALAIEDTATECARRWLDDRFPNWGDASAYWD